MWTSIFLGRTSYGLGIDTNGFIWHANYDWDTVQKITPGGAIVGTSGGNGDRGVAVTPVDNHVWVANSWGGTVSRLANNGTLLTTIPVGSTPTGVSVDADGKVWVTNYGSDNAMRIDPRLTVDDFVTISEEVLGRNSHFLNPQTDYWVAQRVSRGVSAVGDEGYSCRCRPCQCSRSTPRSSLSGTSSWLSPAMISAPFSRLMISMNHW